MCFLELPTSHPESSGVIRSHPELSDVVQSYPTSFRVIRRRPKSFGFVWSWWLQCAYDQKSYFVVIYYILLCACTSYIALCIECRLSTTPDDFGRLLMLPDDFDRRLQTTLDDSRRLRMTPDDSRRLRTTQDHSGPLQTTSDDSERLRTMLSRSTFRSQFQNCRCRIGLRIFAIHTQHKSTHFIVWNVFFLHLYFVIITLPSFYCNHCASGSFWSKFPLTICKRMLKLNFYPSSKHKRAQAQTSNKMQTYRVNALLLSLAGLRPPS